MVGQRHQTTHSYRACCNLFDKTLGPSYNQGFYQAIINANNNTMMGGLYRNEPEYNHFKVWYA